MAAFDSKTVSLGPFLLLSLGACAAGPDPAAAAWSGPMPDGERLVSDVTWLADDARAGRRAGTEGELQAARWIAARLEELGLEPAGSEGWLQPFSVPLPVEDEGRSRVRSVAGDVIVEGETDLVPLFCSEGGGSAG